MKFVRILFLLCLTFQAFAQEKTVAFKLNLVKGESTVTVLPNQKAVEKIFTDAITQKGYTVVTQSTVPTTDLADARSLILVDAFVYQFPADYPSITLTIRKDGKVLTLVHESKKLFLDRQNAAETIATELARQIPASVEEDQFLLPELENLLPQHTVSIYTVTSAAITNSYAKKYIIDTSNSNIKAPDFIINGAFEEYLSLCLDFNGFRKAAKQEPMVVEFAIDKFGYTQATNIKASAAIQEVHLAKIKAAIEALPLWNQTGGQPVTGSLTIGLQK
jgi:hypothetical protein